MQLMVVALVAAIFLGFLAYASFCRLLRTVDHMVDAEQAEHLNGLAAVVDKFARRAWPRRMFKVGVRK